MKIAKFTVIVWLCLLTACNQEHNYPTRSFLMGFIPGPSAESAGQSVITKLPSSADIINLHFENSIPWDEALEGKPFPAAVMADWHSRLANAPAGSAVYVSVTALTSASNTLISDFREDGEVDSVDPWNHFQFNDDEVRSAYVAYCSRLIDFFRPAYFNMAVDANRLFLRSPDLWSGFLEFHEHVYHELKGRYPQVVIFSSVSAGPMIEHFYAGVDHVKQKLAAMQIIENSDLFGISFNSTGSFEGKGTYPSNVFEKMFGLSAKRPAVCETRYPSAIELAGSPSPMRSTMRRENFLSGLLRACEKYHAEMVISMPVEGYNSVVFSNPVASLKKLPSASVQTSALWNAYFQKKLTRE